jgi:hypothetical protein
MFVEPVTAKLPVITALPVKGNPTPLPPLPEIDEDKKVKLSSISW